MGWVGLGTFCWGSSSQPGRNRPRQGKVARRSRMMVGVGIGLFFFVVQLSVSFCLVLFLVVFVLLAHHDGVFPSFFSLWRQRPAACITRPDRWIRWDTHTHTHTHTYRPTHRHRLRYLPHSYTSHAETARLWLSLISLHASCSSISCVLRSHLTHQQSQDSAPVDFFQFASTLR
ncbi:hypothetical protein HDK77DRAFT_245404 [Phyllosticta capitalensis]